MLGTKQWCHPQFAMFTCCQCSRHLALTACRKLAQNTGKWANVLDIYFTLHHTHGWSLLNSVSGLPEFDPSRLFASWSGHRDLWPYHEGFYSPLLSPVITSAINTPGGTLAVVCVLEMYRPQGYIFHSLCLGREFFPSPNSLAMGVF